MKTPGRGVFAPPFGSSGNDMSAVQLAHRASQGRFKGMDLENSTVTLLDSQVPATWGTASAARGDRQGAP